MVAVVAISAATFFGLLGAVLYANSALNAGFSFVGYIA